MFATGPSPVSFRTRSHPLARAPVYAVEMETKRCWLEGSRARPAGNVPSANTPTGTASVSVPFDSSNSVTEPANSLAAKTSPVAGSIAIPVTELDAPTGSPLDESKRRPSIGWEVGIGLAGRDAVGSEATEAPGRGWTGAGVPTVVAGGRALTIKRTATTAPAAARDAGAMNGMVLGGGLLHPADTGLLRRAPVELRPPDAAHLRLGDRHGPVLHHHPGERRGQEAARDRLRREAPERGLDRHHHEDRARNGGRDRDRDRRGDGRRRGGRGRGHAHGPRRDDEDLALGKRLRDHARLVGYGVDRRAEQSADRPATQGEAGRGGARVDRNGAERGTGVDHVERDRPRVADLQLVVRGGGAPVPAVRSDARGYGDRRIQLAVREYPEGRGARDGEVGVPGERHVPERHETEHRSVRTHRDDGVHQRAEADRSERVHQGRVPGVRGRYRPMGDVLEPSRGAVRTREEDRAVPAPTGRLGQRATGEEDIGGVLGDRRTAGPSALGTGVRRPTLRPGVRGGV